MVPRGVSKVNTHFLIQRKACCATEKMLATEFKSYFSRYELLIEFKNLVNQNHLPNGMYVAPEINNLYVWHCCLFIHRGYYKGGVFKFIINIPSTYPNDGPKVTFVTDMFHPLIDPRSREFSLTQQFSTWFARV